MRHGAAAQPSGPAPNRLCAPESSRNPRLQTDLYKKQTGFSFSESGLRLSKNLCRTAIKIGRGGVYVAPAADFFAGKSYFPEKKSLPCRFHDRNPKDSSEIWRGWQWRGSLLPRPPACQKDFFDKLKRHDSSRRFFAEDRNSRHI